MTSQNQFFPGQSDDEKIFLLIRKHWFTYMTFWIFAFFALVFAILGIVFLFVYQNDLEPIFIDSAIIGISVFLLFVLAVMLYGFIDQYLDIYIITDRRIIDISQNGFFRRDISELHLHQVQDVDARVNSIFGTILHFGDVYIQTAGERENFIFRSVSRPFTIAKQIINLHESHIEQGEEKNLNFSHALKVNTPEGAPFQEVMQETEETETDIARPPVKSLDIESITEEDYRF